LHLLVIRYVNASGPFKVTEEIGERTRWNRIVSVTPLQGTRSWRTSLRAGKARDARAKEREEIMRSEVKPLRLTIGQSLSTLQRETL
jgi:hypothetical protein